MLVLRMQCSLERRRPREPNAVSHYSHLSSPREGAPQQCCAGSRHKAPKGELNPRLLSVEPRVARTDALPIQVALLRSTFSGRR